MQEDVIKGLTSRPRVCVGWTLRRFHIDSVMPHMWRSMKMCFPGCVMLMLVNLYTGEKTLSKLLQAVLQGIQRHKGHVFLWFAPCIPMPLQHLWNRSSSQSQSSARLHLPLPSLPLLPMSLAPDMTHMTAVFSVCCWVPWRSFTRHSKDASSKARWGA